MSTRRTSNAAPPTLELLGALLQQPQACAAIRRSGGAIELESDPSLMSGDAVRGLAEILSRSFRLIGRSERILVFRGGAPGGEEITVTLERGV